MSSATIKAAVERDRWAVGQGENEGKPLIVRFRPEMRVIEDVTGYPELFLVNWNYSPDSEGLPSDEETEALDEFEDVMLTSLERDCHTVLTCVVTNDGSRQWVFYSSGIDEAVERINALPQKKTPYPIELMADEDEEWVYLKENILGDCDDPDDAESDEATDSSSDE